MGVKITETVLRDAHQSLLATRLRTEDMLPIAEALDQAGFYSLEVWGGATFDTALRYLNEDPWERLRLLRAAIPNTKLQMLLRGQNLVGYRHYADDVVERFVVKSHENGIDIFRIFDALNDWRNMQKAMEVAKRIGAHVQGTICYTISPVHSLQSFVDLGYRLAELGADSLCIKDMAGLLAPNVAFELVKALKKEVALPVHLHTHHTSGMGTAALLKAIEAGVDGVDTAISSLSLGTSHAPTETIVSILRGTTQDSGIALEKLVPIARYFQEVRKKYKEYDTEFIPVDVTVLTHQVPGGMVSNLIAQLREQGALDKLDQVLDEIPRVREDLGYPPLVTPSSQIVGTQAVLNVLTGQRYQVLSREVRNYIRGLYGQPPGPIAPFLRERIIQEGEEIITCRPADILEPELEKAAQEIGALAQSEEDVLSYVLFPSVAAAFFEARQRGGLDPSFVAAVAAAVGMTAAPEEPVQQAAAMNGSPWKLIGRERFLVRRW